MKKSSYSEENFLSANPKLAEYLRQNPRFPKKMKSVKSKHLNPKISTVGHVSCGGKNDFSAIPFGLSKADPFRQELMKVEDDTPWSKLHRTFSNSQSSRNFLHSADYSSTEKTHCDSVRVLDIEPSKESTPAPNENVVYLPACVTRKTSEAGVQVNMFHCRDCRRHVQFGKTFKQEHSCNESGSETNLLPSTAYSTADQKENKIDIDDNAVKEDNKNKHETNSFQHHEYPSSFACTYHKSLPLIESALPCENNSPTERSDILAAGGDATSRGNGNDFQLTKCSQSVGRKKIWHKGMTILIVTIIVISLTLYFTPIIATISKINVFINYIIGQKEAEQHSSSFFGWFFNLFFGLQGHPKFFPLLLNLF